MEHELRGADLGSGGPKPTKPGLSPWTAFAIVLLLLTATGIWLLTTQPSGEPILEPQVAGTRVAPPSDEEAIAIFENLNELRLDAYANSDPSLVTEVFASGTPIANRVARELRQLSRDGVVARIKFVSKDLIVESATASQIRLHQTAHVVMKFMTEDGEDVTTSPGLGRQVIDWTLQRLATGWRISDAVTVDARRAESRANK